MLIASGLSGSAAFAALLGALAVLAWPVSLARARAAGLVRRRSARSVLAAWRTRIRWDTRSAPIVVGAGVVLSVALSLLGVPATVAVALLAVAAAVHVRARLDARRRIAATARFAEAVRTLVGGLRAGAHPAEAAETAAADADEHSEGVLTTIAASTRLGGEPDAGSLVGGRAVTGAIAVRLTTAWSLARQHGLPLATVLEAVQRDVEARARLVSQVDARMAGPRASSAVLAGLPVFGVLLGEAMGAEPMRVLFTTGVGQALLVLGATFLLAGVAWSSAITGRVTTR